MKKLNILAFGAHPDDIELSAGGTLALHVKMGQTVGLVDLTYGELGTRGNKEIREEEAKNASEIIGASMRMNMGFKDGFFENNEFHQKELIRVIRHYRPDIVLCNAIDDRHPDHGRASKLVSDSCFYSGLRRIETQWSGESQEAWRPKAVYHYIQFYDLKPDFLVDISQVFQTKMDSIKAHASQFYNPHSNEPDTLISSPEFLTNIQNRASYFGQYIGVKYAEGYMVERYPGVRSLSDLI